MSTRGAVARAVHPLTLHGYWRVVAVVAGSVQLLMMGLFTAAVLVAAVSAERADDLRSQELAVTGLHQGMLEQETGIVRYASLADPRGLAAYSKGGAGAAAAMGRLSRAAAATPRAGQVARAREAAGGWTGWAEGVRQRVASSSKPLRDTATEQEGQQLFATFTTAADELERDLEGARRAATAAQSTAWEVALGTLWIGSFLVGAVLGVGTNRAVGRSVRLAQGLAEAAAEVARSARTRIPYTTRSDEIGELARALQTWQSAAAEREIVLRQAPIGICHLDAQRRIVSANPALAGMLRISPEQLVGRLFRSFIPPDDLDPTRGTPLAGLATGKVDRVSLEHRLIRVDGSVLWCSAVHAALRGADGELEGFLTIVEDISARREQQDRAARIQRALLPQTVPLLRGYQLAGACRPARDVAGDFYDWTLSEDGQLDLTVADVMGKGVGPGLVMATVRAVLRAAPPELGPSARVGVAAEFLAESSGDEGLFVTLFHGRLDPNTGVLRYVDAGHGYVTVRRASGELERMGKHSLPLGIWPDQEFAEGVVRLEPGDTLIVHSDGLVETEERTGDLSEFARELDEASGAEEMVSRLMRQLPVFLQDDVTVLALTRAPMVSPAIATTRRPPGPMAVAKVEARPEREAAAAPPPREPEAPPSRRPGPDPEDEDDAFTAAGSPRLLGFLPARTQRQAVTAGSIFGLVLHLMLVTLVSMGILVASASGVRENQAWDEQLLLGTLRSGLLEQRVGIDAYASSADPGLLAPYEAGRGDVDRALAGLRRERVGAPGAGQVARAGAAIGDWQLWAEALRERVAGSGRPVTDTAVESQGDVLSTRATTATDALAGELDGAQATADTDEVRGWIFALVSLFIGSAVVGTLITIGITSSQLVGGALGSLAGLARAAREIAMGGQARIPDVERSDEFGELARALHAWQSASAAHAIMIRQAPIGIAHLNREGRVTEANLALGAMRGHSGPGLLGGKYLDLVHAEDRAGQATALQAIAEDAVDHAHTECRMVRADGSLVWCSAIHAGLRGADGDLEGFVVIVEDISERKQQLERAAQIQRGLLPQATPQLQSYDLAGACQPAEDVAGDFYDWTVPVKGQLDVTVADVMGKGVGSGLVMATMRAVLRAARPELGPAARVGLAAEFLAVGAGDEGLFVTLFHGRLDLASGVLRYVDAGHGYVAVRRASGELERLGKRSLPLGIWPGDFLEGTVRFLPGDTLIVYSDGLVETEERTSDLSEYTSELDEAPDAREMVRRLMRRAPTHPQDDVTVLALHRAPMG